VERLLTFRDADPVKISTLIDLPPETDAMTGLEAIAERDPVVWCMLNRRVKGDPIIFDNTRALTDESLGELRRTLVADSDYDTEVLGRLQRHRPWQRQPMRDLHRHKVYEKSRQVGVTEVSENEVFHFLAHHPGTKWITTFPREKQLTDFSNTRVAAAFADTPRMAALVGTPNQVFTRRVGDSYWLFRSAWESNLGEGEPADGVTLDEKDRMRDKIEFAFKEALKSSKWGFFREISTPTLPRQGIDLPFSKSDQQTWLVRCKRCGERQPIDHKENIVQVKSFPIGCQELPPGAFEFQCRKQKCRGELDRVYSGEWVPKYPDRKHIRGYAISQLMAAWISATQVMQDKIDMRFPEIWLNYVVGVPAGSDMEMLNDVDFERSCAGHQLYTSRTPAWSHVTYGVDWGNLNWVVVLGRNKYNQRPYVIGVDVFEDTQVELESAKRVLSYVNQFNPDMGAADAGYGKDRNALMLRAMCPNGDEGKFWIQQYDQNPKTSKTFVPEWSDPSRARVTVSRLIQLKNAARVVKEREIGFPNLEIPIVDALKRHLKSLVPFREIDEETKQVVETVKTSGEDHLAHAFGSALLCMERLSKQSRFNFSFE